MILLTDLLKEAFWSKKPKTGYSENFKLKSGETITIEIKNLDTYPDFTALTIVAIYNGKQIGGAHFNSDEINGPKKLTSTDTYVNDAFQRKGVASKIYNFAQSLGYQILPSSDQTPKGKEFFKAWKLGN